ncbi:MAG: hypothetical protein AAF497_13530 [Planctomycetota bacterium]
MRHSQVHKTMGDKLEWIREQISHTRLASLDRLKIDPNSVAPAYEMPFVFDAFRESIANEYQSIFFDLPPIENSIRVLSMAGICQGVIMIVKGRSTRATHAKSAINVLEENQIKVLGVVVNLALPALPGFLRKWF